MFALYAVLVLTIVFFVLWFAARPGWMTKLWSVVTAGFIGMGEILPVVSNADWHAMVGPREAALIGMGCAVLIVLTRMRGSIRGR